MLLNQDGWRSTYCVDLPMNFAQNLVMFREVIEAMLVWYSATKTSTNITPAKQEPYFLISERKNPMGYRSSAQGSLPVCLYSSNGWPHMPYIGYWPDLGTHTYDMYMCELILTRLHSLEL